MLRCGIGIDIRMLQSATIMDEPDFVSMWFGDSLESANNCGLCLCYDVIAFANFLADLFLYFIAQIARGG